MTVLERFVADNPQSLFVLGIPFEEDDFVLKCIHDEKYFSIKGDEVEIEELEYVYALGRLDHCLYQASLLDHEWQRAICYIAEVAGVKFAGCIPLDEDASRRCAENCSHYYSSKGYQDYCSKTWTPPDQMSGKQKKQFDQEEAFVMKKFSDARVEGVIEWYLDHWRFEQVVEKLQEQLCEKPKKKQKVTH